MIAKQLKKYSPRLTAAVILCIFSSLSSPVAFAQDFSSIDNDLQTLEDLKKNLDESGNLIASYENTITEQEKLLASLREQLNAMYETYRKQSALSARYAQSSKFWKTFTLVAIPVTALISGTLVWAVGR